MELSIIVPHHKDESALKKLLKSLHSKVKNIDFEIIVVSNPPSFRAQKICKRYSLTRHYNINIISVNAARNFAMDNAKGEILFFADSDCQFDDPELLQKHLQYHRAHQDISCLGGMYRTLRGNTLCQAYAYNQRKWLFQGVSGTESKYLIGGHFSCKGSAIAGFRFDEGIAYGGSEMEFFIRLRLAGKKLFLMKALEIRHEFKMSWSTLVKKLFKQGAGARYIYEKLGVSTGGVILNFDVSELQRTAYRSSFDLPIEIMKVSFHMGFDGKVKRLNSSAIADLLVKTAFRFYSARFSKFRVIFLQLLKTPENKS